MRRHNILGKLFAVYFFLLACFGVWLAVSSGSWKSIRASVQAADIDAGPTGQEACRDFVAKNPRAEVICADTCAVELSAYRYVILEGRDRERLQIMYHLGYIRSTAVSQRDESCVVEGDMVDLELITPSPYVRLIRKK